MINYTITVENHSTSEQEFYFYQEPAAFSSGKSVYANSLGKASLDAYKPSATQQIQFEYECQHYAGVQNRINDLKAGVKQLGVITQVPILTKAGGTTLNKTNVIIGENSVSLTEPAGDTSVREGAFRLTTPTFDNINKKINIGLSGKTQRGQILLSSFIEGEPLKNTDVEPKSKFYVSVGSYELGTVVDLANTSTNKAVCDTNVLGKNIMAIYKADGTWEVKSTL